MVFPTWSISQKEWPEHFCPGLDRLFGGELHLDGSRLQIIQSLLSRLCGGQLEALLASVSIQTIYINILVACKPVMRAITNL